MRVEPAEGASVVKCSPERLPQRPAPVHGNDGHLAVVCLIGCTGRREVLAPHSIQSGRVVFPDSCSHFNIQESEQKEEVADVAERQVALSFAQKSVAVPVVAVPAVCEMNTTFSARASTAIRKKCSCSLNSETVGSRFTYFAAKISAHFMMRGFHTRQSPCIT